MALFDLPIEELRTYRPALDEPDGFDAFWDATLAEAADAGTPPRTEAIDNRLTVIDTWDVTFSGFGGQDVRAWLHVPTGATGPLPAVVCYQGYSAGRGMPLHTSFAQAGYAQFTLDTRGQGWTSPTAFDTTPDADVHAGDTAVPGQMTRGILSPESWYYRRLMVDAVRLLQVAAAHPLVDAGRIVATGASQGGGLSLAAAALGPRVGVNVAAVMADVPFLCHFRRAVDVGTKAPYSEIAQYLACFPGRIDQVFWTLSHFDGVHFARRIGCPALFSVAQMDEICPPSTVFAAYNALTVDKEIAVYPYNGHEGGTTGQVWRQLGWLRDRIAVSSR